jgi:hypothetical protein
MISKTYYILLLSLLSCSTILYSIIPTTRQLMIFNECGDYENIAMTLDQDPQLSIKPVGVGAITNAFLLAFYQEAGPLLIPSGILGNVMSHAALFNEFTNKNKSVNQLFEKYKTYKRFAHLNLVKQFRENCLYGAALYDHLISQLKSWTKGTNIKQALLKDPMFTRERAPEKLKNIDYTNGYIELWTYLLCAHIPSHKYKVTMITTPDRQTFYLCIPNSYIDQINKNYKEPNLKELD